MSEIAGRLVPLLVDFTGAGTSFKTLVCLQQFDESIDVPIDVQETDCGQKSAPGTPGATVNFTAVCETEPTSDQATLQDCKEAAVAGTRCMVKIESPAEGSVSAGDAFYSSYYVYFGNITTQKQTSQTITFTGTMQSTGTLTVIKP
jgi:hypothetical protein